MIKISTERFDNLPLEKQDRIRNVALTEFSEKGYEAASINVMVKNLGIAKGSIFQYFGDKQGLFLFVFSEAVEQIKNYLRKVREEYYQENLFVRLEQTLLAGVEFTKENPRILNLYLKTLVEVDIPYRDEILLALRSSSLGYIGAMLDLSRERGEISEDIDLKKAGFIIDAVMDRFLQTRVTKNFDAEMGIFNAGDSVIMSWISEIISILKTGISISTPASSEKEA